MWSTVFPHRYIPTTTTYFAMELLNLVMMSIFANMIDIPI
ncbi:hypothetical protein X975_23824, partial [Stegodyphus mimosarum]